MIATLLLLAISSAGMDYTVVVPDYAEPIKQYAAEELAHHVALATDATLESNGKTSVADRAGIIETDSWQDVPGFQDEWQEPPSLFRDAALENGFRLSALRSSARPVVIGTVLAQVDAPDPQWRLAQWGTRFNLVDAEEQMRDGVRILANEGKEVRVYPGGVSGEGVYLAVHGGAEYDGNLRQHGEPWPHLLIEQSFEEDNRPSTYEALRLQLTFRIEKAEPLAAELDPSLHTAHITVFFVLRNVNPESPGHRDMIWFGIPLFDARHAIPPGHRAVDAGQPDASGKFICTIAGSRFWDSPTGDGAWHTFDRDLLPLMQEALAIAQKAGHCTETRWEDVAATSVNLGWEVPGTYDCAVRIRSLRLGPEREARRGLSQREGRAAWTVPFLRTSTESSARGVQSTRRPRLLRTVPPLLRIPFFTSPSAPQVASEFSP